MLSLCYIHCDPEVFTGFTRGIVMSYGAQEPDPAVVGTRNPKFADIVIRSCADCIFKSCPHSQFVFRVDSGPKAFEWNRALAWIEAVQASCFVRYMEVLLCDEI